VGGGSFRRDAPATLIWKSNPSSSHARLTQQVQAAHVIIEGHAAQSAGEVAREWLIAFGTVGATFVAVYVGVLRERWRRPKLTLEYGGPSHGDAVVAQSADGWAGAYVRLRVTAAKRRYAAEDVEVMVLGVRELEPRETYPPASGGVAIDGQLLGWSNTESTRMTIPSDTHRHLDLLHIVKSETASGTASTWIAVQPVYDDRHGTKSGKFELELAVSARNANARRYRVVVHYDGGWGVDPWQHLAVDTPTQLR
jgi:hypothetical protein